MLAPATESPQWLLTDCSHQRTSASVFGNRHAVAICHSANASSIVTIALHRERPSPNPPPPRAAARAGPNHAPRKQPFNGENRPTTDGHSSVSGAGSAGVFTCNPLPSRIELNGSSR